MTVRIRIREKSASHDGSVFGGVGRAEVTWDKSLLGVVELVPLVCVDTHGFLLLQRHLHAPTGSSL